MRRFQNLMFHRQEYKRFSRPVGQTPISAHSVLGESSESNVRNSSKGKEENDSQSKMSNESILPAVLYLLSLSSTKQSKGLIDYFSTFQSEKEYSLEVFITGIKQFSRLANLTAAEREKFYGNQFLGLHYSSDLAKLWNDHSADTIKAHQLSHICPSEWEQRFEESYHNLIYKGDKPSIALNKLLQGPTVIDCNMYAQICFWFGAKYMLGDRKFDKVFGNAPLYITQFVYNEVASAFKPYSGNPLFPFFDFTNMTDEEMMHEVCITHVKNHTAYLIKHPGGSYDGQNCVVVKGEYNVFDPNLKRKSNLNRKDVEVTLREALNADQNVDDRDRIAIYKEQDPLAINPKLGMNYQALIERSEKMADTVFKEKEWRKDTILAAKFNLRFNFDKFCTWINRLNERAAKSNYTPLSAEKLDVPISLIEKIPFENRNTMSFSTFINATPLQDKMSSLSKQFCSDVMSNHSCCIVLTGNAGIGKTASAVCCAKELSSRGKKVLWISEVMVRGWIDKAISLSEVEGCADEIKKLLQGDFDAVFLDDDNLVGYAGKVLLEEMYAWYVCHPGKGLFITSNEPITLKSCYGLQSNLEYKFAPFPGYTSEQYENTYVCRDLRGESKRLKPVENIMEYSDEERLQALINYQGEPSVGIVISKETFEKEMQYLHGVEFIPGISESETLPLIIQSLNKNAGPGPVYYALSAKQKEWLQAFQAGGHTWDSVGLGGKVQYKQIPLHPSMKVRHFEKTDCPMVAVELLKSTSCFNGDIIDDTCLLQLLTVLNYVHDCGGRKVFIVNSTTFSDAELLEKIKDGIPKREKARTISRLETLLFSPDLLKGVSSDRESKEEKDQSQRLKHENEAMEDCAPFSKGITFRESHKRKCQSKSDINGAKATERNVKKRKRS